MQIQEWESTVRGAVIMEQALVHGSQNPTWPQKERAAHIQRQSSTGRNDLSASLLYVWPWLVYWPQPFEWHPKPELCTPKFPFVPDEINSHPVALYQAEQVSCSKCERSHLGLEGRSRPLLTASGLVSSGSAGAGTTSWFCQGQTFILRHAAQLWQNSWACIVLMSSAPWSRNHTGS